MPETTVQDTSKPAMLRLTTGVPLFKVTHETARKSAARHGAASPKPVDLTMPIIDTFILQDDFSVTIDPDADPLAHKMVELGLYKPALLVEVSAILRGSSACPYGSVMDQQIGSYATTTILPMDDFIDHQGTLHEHEINLIPTGFTQGTRDGKCSAYVIPKSDGEGGARPASITVYLKPAESDGEKICLALEASVTISARIMIAREDLLG